jgi:UDP:flavonoid glycosyltransferase YjiC (YdhE family)
MRITIVSAGSQGDIQPYLALAVGLKRRGFNVRFAANSNFAGLAARYALDFFPIQVDSYKFVQTPQAQAWLGSDSTLKLVLNTLRAIRPVMGQIFADVFDACRESDLILYHSFALPYVYYIGKQLNIPCIPASIDPLPTRAHPALPLNIKSRRNGTFNLLTHLLVDQFAWQVFLPVVRRSGQAGKSIPLISPYKKILEERGLILCAYSAAVLPRPADLPEQVNITGYWFLELDPNWSPDPQLVEFIESGPRPIYIGFGSMGNPEDNHMTAGLVFKALAETGQRAVLGAGWSEMGSGQRLPDNVFMLKSIPHNWLFPRMKAIVHHAGPGTTAAALSSGMPSVAVPHFASQFFYGDRLAEIGAAPAPIPRRKLSAQRLAHAISAATTDGNMQDRASAIGAQIRAEDGIEQAVRAIRQFIDGGTANQRRKEPT